MKYLALLLLLCGVVFSQTGKETYTQIKSENLINTVEKLCSDDFAGRLAGSEGYYKAADYIKSELENAGLKPAFDGSYFQEFEVEYNEFTDTPKLALVENDEVVKEYKNGSEFVCRGFSGSGNITAEVVFCGYGISRENGYNDYADVDVKDKIALVFKYNPKWKPEGENWANNYPREKSHMAFENGAKGILFVSLPLDRNPQKPIASVLSGEGEQNENFPQIHVDLSVAKDLFKNSGTSLKELQAKIKSTHKPASVALGTTVNMMVHTKYKKDKKTVNVGALIPGSDPKLKDEYVVIGAHLDHVGTHGNVKFAGANDNASGSAALLEVAKTFGKNDIKPDRSIIFVFFSSEEAGLFGAQNFVDNSPVDVKNIATMINMDCVGHGDAIRVGGGISAPVIYGKITELDKEFTKMMIKNTWWGGGADATPFFEKGIPTTYFVTSNSYTYLHQPEDLPETLNHVLFERITQLAYLTLNEAASKNYEREQIFAKNDD